MSRHDSLIVLWRRRVYGGGSCKVAKVSKQVVMSFCVAGVECREKCRKSCCVTGARCSEDELDFSVAGAALQMCRIACFLRIALSGLRQVVTRCKFPGRCGTLTS